MNRNAVWPGGLTIRIVWRSGDLLRAQPRWGWEYFGIGYPG